MMTRFAFFVAATLSLPAAGQTISSIAVEPATALAGTPVKVTVAFTSADSPNCNVRVHFGDGQTQDFKINQLKDLPVVATHTYAAAGTYRVMAEGKTALPVLKCLGPNQMASVKVAAAAPAPGTTPPPAPLTAPGAAGKPGAVNPAAAMCPPGWKLDAKSVSKKSGAFACTAKAGTALPAIKLECPSPLGYFENQSKGRLGCRP